MVGGCDRIQSCESPRGPEDEKGPRDQLAHHFHLVAVWSCVVLSPHLAASGLGSRLEGTACRAGKHGLKTTQGA